MKFAIPILIFGCFASVGNAWVFHGQAGAGYVIDAVTGKGLEGVFVEASWVVTNYRDPSAPPLFEVFHDHTVTDPSGRFVLPAWGPVEVDLNSSIKSVVKILSHSQPQLYLYKPGYRPFAGKGPDDDPRPFWNQLHFTAEETREEWWNLHVFMLVPDSATPGSQPRDPAH